MEEKERWREKEMRDGKRRDGQSKDERNRSSLHKGYKYPGNHDSIIRHVSSTAVSLGINKHVSLICTDLGVSAYS